MAVAALALPRLQLFDANGNPLASGRLYSYHAGTTTPLATYNSAAGTGVNTNPVIADAGGFMDVWLTASTAYKISIHAANDTVMSTIDNIIVPVPLSDGTTIPSGVSDTVAEGNSGMDPGEPGSEILAQNVAQEVLQLRTMVSELKNLSNWRQSRETLAQFQFNLDTGDAGTEVLPLFGEQELQQLHFVLRALKGGATDVVPWYQKRELLASMQLGIDPGEVGTEVLPLFGLQQLQQLRFVIEEMKGTPQWYTTKTTRIAYLGYSSYAIAGWPHGSTTIYSWLVPAPLGMDFSQNSTVKLFLTDSVAAGNVQLSYTAVLIKDTQPQFGLAFTEAPWTPAAANTSYLRFFPFGPNIFSGNDAIVFQVRREGTDPADTNTGAVAFLGGWFEYIGIASR